MHQGPTRQIPAERFPYHPVQRPRFGDLLENILIDDALFPGRVFESGPVSLILPVVRIYVDQFTPVTFEARERGSIMKHFTAVIERDADTGLYVGWIPGFIGAHSQGETLDELHANLQEVVEMLLEEGDPRLESIFIGTQIVEVG